MEASIASGTAGISGFSKHRAVERRHARYALYNGAYCDNLQMPQQATTPVLLLVQMLA